MGKMFSYDEFKEKAAFLLAERFKDAELGEIALRSVTKNNGVNLDALTPVGENRSCRPLVYINDLYQRYTEGDSIEELIDQAEMTLKEHMDDFDDELCDHILDFEYAKNKIVLRLVNYDQNKELLDKMPHIRILDLALTFRLIISHGPGVIGTTAVSNEMLESWGKTSQEIYALACDNVNFLFEAEFMPLGQMMESLLQNIPDTDADYILRESEEQMDTGIHVLTNTCRMGGAVMLFVTDVLKEFARKTDCDIYVLPSSIHEFLLLPALPEIEVEALSEIVKETNRECVLDEEILSDHVYKYIKSEDKLTIAV